MYLAVPGALLFESCSLPSSSCTVPITTILYCERALPTDHLGTNHQDHQPDLKHTLRAEGHSIDDGGQRDGHQWSRCDPQVEK